MRVDAKWMVDIMNKDIQAHEWVTPEGVLNEANIVDREPLYQGMNGRYVERFTVHTGESYIFKPLTHDAQYGREQWVAQHIFPELAFLVPQLIASSAAGTAPEQSWLIYEDLGHLSHDLSENTMLLVAVMMAYWHTLSTTAWNDLPRVGQKPSIRDMLRDLLDHQQETETLLSSLETTLTSANWEELTLQIRNAEKHLPLVLSHGDLHPGNIAEVQGRLVIIDWEHAHLNTPLWDMYHLVDLSHPLFPRTVTPQLRELVIRVYLDHLQACGVEIEPDSFATWYHAYAFVFSLWMLRLIDRDLNNVDCIWPEEQLRAQWQETAATLRQCMNRLFTE